MEFWLQVFSIVAAIALVVQVVILGALFFELRRTTEKVNKLVSDLQTRVGPLLSRVQLLLDDTQPRISELVADASHVVYLARAQAQKMDRVLTEASDLLRGQLIHADRILSGTLEAVEETGAKLRQGFWRPMRKASAVVTGIRVGLDLLRSRRASRRPEEQHEEELFI
jgi:ABC-type transporter Mla subunit MlaD